MSIQTCQFDPECSEVEICYNNEILKQSGLKGQHISARGKTT